MKNADDYDYNYNNDYNNTHLTLIVVHDRKYSVADKKINARFKICSVSNLLTNLSDLLVFEVADAGRVVAVSFV